MHFIDRDITNIDVGSNICNDFPSSRIHVQLLLSVQESHFQLLVPPHMLVLSLTSVLGLILVLVRNHGAWALPLSRERMWMTFLDHPQQRAVTIPPSACGSSSNSHILS